jgi:hypothetical protein
MYKDGMGNSLNHKMEKKLRWVAGQIERDKEAGRWIDRQTEGWMDGWMDGWTE